MGAPTAAVPESFKAVAVGGGGGVSDPPPPQAASATGKEIAAICWTRRFNFKVCSLKLWCTATQGLAVRPFFDRVVWAAIDQKDERAHAQRKSVKNLALAW